MVLYGESQSKGSIAHHFAGWEQYIIIMKVVVRADPWGVTMADSNWLYRNNVNTNACPCSNKHTTPGKHGKGQIPDV